MGEAVKQSVFQQPVVPQPVFPKGVLLGAGALMLFTIGIATTARLTHSGHVALPPTTAVASRDLGFADRRDGGIDVTDVSTGQLITVVPPKTGGFIRGIMRGLVRDHRLNEQASGTAFRLTRWADGRLSIADPATNESFELEAFGSTNEAVFARFLEARTFVSEAAPAQGADGRWTNGWRTTIDVPCTIDLEQTPDSLHAYVDLDGVAPGPGDEVLVHDAPSGVAFGEKSFVERRATLRRAGPLQKVWAHIEGYLELTELYEVSFSEGRAR